MTARFLIQMGVLVVAAALAVGCGGPTGTAEVVAAEQPSSSPSVPAPSAASRALAALQASVADLGAVEVSGGTPGGDVRGRIRAASDLRTGDFRVTVDLGADAGVLRMIRQSDLTWTKAPPDFWTRLGYTAESARRAQGKWVVARAETIRPLVQSLDPGVAVRALLELSAQDVISVGTVATGDLRGQRVLRFRQGGREQRVYLTNGARPRLLRISGASDSASTELDFLAFPPRVQVSLPTASDVLPPS